MEKKIEVVATAPGFYGRYRTAGDKFNVAADHRKSSWFTPVDNDEQAPGDEGLEALGVPALKELLTAKQIPFKGNASKSALIDLLKNPPHPDDLEDEDLA